jgi:hypothetical protein
VDGYQIRPYKPGLRIKGRTITEKTLLITCFPKSGIDRKEIHTWFAEHAKYAICGKERCPRTGRTHYHIYAEFENMDQYKWMSKCFPEWHIDANIKDANHAKDHAVKDGQVRWEIGEQKIQSQARTLRSSENKWGDILGLAFQGKMEEIMQRYPGEFLRYRATLTNIATKE